MDGYNYANLKTIDLTYFDTSRVTNMSSMFNYGFSGQTSNGSQLHTIIFGDKWDTSQVTDMSFMFSGQEQLTSLDLSGFDTSQVTNMMSMFEWCLNLTNLEQQARSMLGMQKLTNKQTEYINLPKTDYIEAASEQVIIEEKPGLLETIGNYIAQLFK